MRHKGRKDARVRSRRVVAVRERCLKYRPTLQGMDSQGDGTAMSPGRRRELGGRDERCEEKDDEHTDLCTGSAVWVQRHEGEKRGMQSDERDGEAERGLWATTSGRPRLAVSRLARSPGVFRRSPRGRAPIPVLRAWYLSAKR